MSDIGERLVQYLQETYNKRYGSDYPVASFLWRADSLLAKFDMVEKPKPRYRVEMEYNEWRVYRDGCCSAVARFSDHQSACEYIKWKNSQEAK